MNSLLSAIPEIGNVSLVCLIFWLIFSVMGVQFFGGRFYKCVDGDGETLPHTTVADRSSCLAMNYTWKNSDINFDNSLAGFLALFQVVSLRKVRLGINRNFPPRERNLCLLFQATFEGWIEIMADAADVTEVSAIVLTTIRHHTVLGAKRVGTLYITSIFILHAFKIYRYTLRYHIFNIPVSHEYYPGHVINILIIINILIKSSISSLSSMLSWSHHQYHRYHR